MILWRTDPLLGKDRAPMEWPSSDHMGIPTDTPTTIEDLCFLLVRVEGL
jgi:hypothetical protein